ncbi:MAG: exodeoxyribonuclease III [Planctomycetota bacterium]|jgi:exodeoxyribonuclease-3|nr:exodeoxyribonuclease III [Planctomycetota bacterium]
MRAISWNVNSLRTRFERVLGVLERHQPDLLCLQETKVQDEQFPVDALADAGYLSSFHGQKTYNGVALLSKEPLADVQNGFPGDPAPDQARVISCVLDGIRYVNVYVINGKALGTDKFALKMQWLDALTTWLGSFDPKDALVVLGDFNIAPDERDVHDVDKWRGKIHFSEEEHEKLAAMAALGLTDMYREFHSEGGLYSWWDYRGGAFPRDFGLRIDLALGSEAAVKRCSGTLLDRDERKKGDWEAKPSDHVPLILDFRSA